MPDPGEVTPFAPTLLALLVDQKERWGRGERPTVEEYLAREPALAAKVEAALDLIGNEVILRQEAGERLELDEYLRRFPQWGDAIRDLFEVESTLALPPPSELPPAAPGYTILGLLGRGGMGVVYKALDHRLGRVVALKMIQPGLIGGEGPGGALQRFRAEAEAVARLQHPNIVQVFELGEHAGRPFLALEYVAGGNLARRLAGAPQPPREAAALVEVLARAVQYAHDRGILHRDLKPENVLLASGGREPPEVASGGREPPEEGHRERARPASGGSRPPLAILVPKLTDFGLAKQLDRDAGQTRTGAVLGTPSYMAPEQARGEPQEIGPPTDVYALGAILYESLTGRPPFKGTSAVDTLLLVTTEEPVSPSRLGARVARDLETICLKCLEKRPGQRYPRAIDLAEDLRRYLAGEPIEARPIGPMGRLGRWCRRHPARAGLMTTLIVMLVGAVAALFVWQRAEWRREREEQRRGNDLRAAAEGQRALALSELRANRVGSARKVLEQALARLAGEEGLAALRDELQNHHDRAARIEDFQQLADRAERLAFVESDARALAACQAAVRRLRVLEGKGTWWSRLPVDDLTAEQAEQLHREVHHQLLLLAALRVKEGLEGPGGQEATRAYHAALEAVALVQEHRQARKQPRSVAGQVLQTYCWARLGELSRLERLGGLESATASDCYFLGIACFWMSRAPEDGIAKGLRLALRLIGLDLGEPAAMAQQLLRRAAAEEPGRYWSHFWLGWVLLASKEPRGAELAFTTCTTLRPESGLAYAERARAIAFQAQPGLAAPLRKELHRRCRADHTRAVRAGPVEWYLFVPLLEAFIALGWQAEGLEAAGRLLDLLPPAGPDNQRARTEQVQLLQGVLAYLDQQGGTADVLALRAQARLHLGQDEQAQRDVAKALEANAQHPRALAVRAALALRRKGAGLS